MDPTTDDSAGAEASREENTNPEHETETSSLPGTLPSPAVENRNHDQDHQTDQEGFPRYVQGMAIHVLESPKVLIAAHTNDPAKMIEYSISIDLSGEQVSVTPLLGGVDTIKVFFPVTATMDGIVPITGGMPTIAKYNIIKEAQGLGYGRAIITEVLVPRVKAMGYSLIGVQNPSSKSVKFWQKIGFVSIADRLCLEIVPNGLRLLEQPHERKRIRKEPARLKPNESLPAATPTPKPKQTITKKGGRSRVKPNVKSSKKPPPAAPSKSTSGRRGNKASRGTCPGDRSTATTSAHASGDVQPVSESDAIAALSVTVKAMQQRLNSKEEEWSSVMSLARELAGKSAGQSSSGGLPLGSITSSGDNIPRNVIGSSGTAPACGVASYSATATPVVPPSAPHLMSPSPAATPALPPGAVPFLSPPPAAPYVPTPPAPQGMVAVGLPGGGTSYYYPTTPQPPAPTACLPPSGTPVMYYYPTGSPNPHVPFPFGSNYHTPVPPQSQAMVPASFHAPPPVNNHQWTSPFYYRTG